MVWELILILTHIPLFLRVRGIFLYAVPGAVQPKMVAFFCKYIIGCAKLNKKMGTCAVLLRFLFVSAHSSTNMKWVQFSNLHVDVPKDLTKPTVCTPYFLA